MRQRSSKFLQLTPLKTSGEGRKKKVVFNSLCFQTSRNNYASGWHMRGTRLIVFTWWGKETARAQTKEFSILCVCTLFCQNLGGWGNSPFRSQVLLLVAVLRMILKSPKWKKLEERGNLAMFSTTAEVVGMCHGFRSFMQESQEAWMIVRITKWQN